MPVPDTANAAAYQARAQELEAAAQENSRLKAALKALEQRRPERVVVYDTIIDIRRDTVILGAQQDSHGRLTVDLATPDSAGHRPETRTGIQLGDCDDGWTIRAGSVLCDRARFGHLSILARGGTAYDTGAGVLSPSLQAGIRWSQTFRGTWSAEATVDQTGIVRVGVEKQFRLW
jgi:hypothetical protein